MKPLSAPDQLFLWLDKREQPMHVGGLQLFSLPENAPPDFMQRIAERVRNATVAYPPFNQRLEKKHGQWFWDEDKDFDVEHHLRHVALPSPGRIRELLQLVSQFHAAHLDRERPLWEFYLIENVEGKRFAVYSKVHHALVDGVASMRLMMRSMSEDPNAELAPIWAQPPRAREKKDKRETGIFHDLAKIAESARAQLSTLPSVTRELFRAAKSFRKDPDFVSFAQAPKSILNQKITGSRRFAAESYSLARIRAAAKKHDATINDVVLAMCSSALRTYLKDLAALPEKPLIAMVPVSLRRDESDGGNQVALILANLATHLRDPEARLQMIKRSVHDSKERYSRMSPAAIINYTGTMMGPYAVNFLTGMAPSRQPFNLVISNVPGPKKKLYWNGAKLEGFYPASIVLDGQALNITLASYEDNLELGIIACRRTLPHVQRLLEYLDAGLAELE